MKIALTSLLAAVALGGNCLAQTVTIWTPLTGPSLEWLQEESEFYTEAFGAEVEIVQLALGELRERALLEAPEGQAGDVLVGVPHDQVVEMAAGGVLADMGAYATDSYLEDLPESARLAYTFGGRLFGLPLYVEGPALILNTDLVPEVPSTYEEMIALAKEIATEDTFGFTYDITNFYYSYNWIHTFGGYVFGRDAAGDPDPGQIGLASDGAVRGAQDLQALRFEHELIPPDASYGAATTLFREGRLAMTYDGPWVVGGFLDAGIPVEVVPMPPLEDGTRWSGFMGAYGVLLNAHGTSEVYAANLAKWLVRPEAQVSLSRLAGRIPASRSAIARMSDDPIIAGFGAALQDAQPLIGIPEMGRVWQPMADALSTITESADADVKAALEMAVQEIRAQ